MYGGPDMIKYLENEKILDTETRKWHFLFHGTSSYMIDEARKIGKFTKKIHNAEIETAIESIKNKLIRLDYLVEKEDSMSSDNTLTHSLDLWSRMSISERFHLSEIEKNLKEHDTRKKTNWLYKYDHLYLTSDPTTAISFATCQDNALGTTSLGESYNILVYLDYLYRKLTGEWFEYENTTVTTFIKDIFDESGETIKESIKPVVIILKNISLDNLLFENGKEIGDIEDEFVQVHLSTHRNFRYIGDTINYNDLEIIEGINKTELSKKFWEFINKKLPLK